MIKSLFLNQIVKQYREIFLTMQHFSEFQWIKYHINIAVLLMDIGFEKCKKFNYRG